MKTYKITTILIASLFLSSWSYNIEKDIDIKVAPNKDIQFDGKVVTVKKGTPIEFLLNGNKESWSFFCGEKDNEYMIPNEKISSSRLTFTVKSQYGGNADAIKDILKMYISDSFKGINKRNFEADSTLVVNTVWNDLVTQTDLPQKPNTTYVADIDLTKYLGKPVTIGICYKQLRVSQQAGAPRMIFSDMKVVNTMKNGQTITLDANSFGFTPLNMMNKWNLSDQAPMTKNREYGTVTNSIPGIWNLKDMDAGNFYIHSSSGGDPATTPLKYSWLISDPLVINTSARSKGVTVYAELHTYTYDKVGTYEATFVPLNPHSSQKSVHLVIKVIK